MSVMCPAVHRPFHYPFMGSHYSCAHMFCWFTTCFLLFGLVWCIGASSVLHATIYSYDYKLYNICMNWLNT
jgi:hypothetical protein